MCIFSMGGEENICGCTDETASNYDDSATLADGSCEYDIFGCTIAIACNYNAEATVDDGTCDFVSCLSFGCTDSEACNYDEDATFEDGSCTYPSFPYDCNDECVNDNDGDGVCDDLKSLDAPIPPHATTARGPRTTMDHVPMTALAAPTPHATLTMTPSSTTALASSRAALWWAARMPWRATMTRTPNMTTAHAPTFPKARATVTATSLTLWGVWWCVRFRLGMEMACVMTQKSPAAPANLHATTTPRPLWMMDPATSFHV